MWLKPPRGVYETVLYAKDLEAATAFYRDALGLRLVESVDGLVAAFRLSDGSMLLVFDPRNSSMPERLAPSHGAAGSGHVAFRVNGSELAEWRTRLLELGVAIEKEHADPEVGQLYFRDPAGNSVELVRGELWPL